MQSREASEIGSSQEQLLLFKMQNRFVDSDEAAIDTNSSLAKKKRGKKEASSAIINDDHLEGHHQ